MCKRNEEEIKPVIVMSVGLCFASVCVHEDVAPEDIAGHMLPAGTSSGWGVYPEDDDDAENVLKGKSNPEPCDVHGDRRHYLLWC